MTFHDFQFVRRSLVEFVRPNLLGTPKEFQTLFVQPIQEGQCADHSSNEFSLMKGRVFVLRSLTKGVIQRRSDTVLRSTLLSIEDHVLMVHLSERQRDLYEYGMTERVKKNRFFAFSVGSKIWNHPDLVYNSVKSNQTEADLEIDDVKEDDLDNEEYFSTPKKKANLFVPSDWNSVLEGITVIVEIGFVFLN